MTFSLRQKILVALMFLSLVPQDIGKICEWNNMLLIHLSSQRMWFLLEGKFAPWILEGLKYWCVYLLFCLNAVFSTLWRLLVLALDFPMLLGVYLNFFVLIIHFDISFSFDSVFTAIALEIWTSNKFEKIYTYESYSYIVRFSYFNWMR